MCDLLDSCVNYPGSGLVVTEYKIDYYKSYSAAKIAPWTVRSNFLYPLLRS